MKIWAIIAAVIFILVNTWAFLGIKMPFWNIVGINVAFFIGGPLGFFIVCCISNVLPSANITKISASIMALAWFCNLTGITPLEESSKSSTRSEIRQEPSLTGQMDGNAWNNASLESRKALASDISSRLKKKTASDCSANFIYDALNEAFNTTDPALLRQSIAEVTGFCVTMAKSLPESQRNY
jgi:hypothetical protein